MFIAVADRCGVERGLDLVRRQRHLWRRWFPARRTGTGARDSADGSNWMCVAADDEAIVLGTTHLTTAEPRFWLATFFGACRPLRQVGLMESRSGWSSGRFGFADGVLLDGDLAVQCVPG